MASLMFGKQFLVILMVNNLTYIYIYIYIYLIENIMKTLVVNIYIFQEPRVIFFLGFEAFAPTGKVLLMSVCLESSRWLCIEL